MGIVQIEYCCKMLRKYLSGSVFVLIICINSNAQENKIGYFINSGITFNQMPKTTRVASINDFGISKNNNEFKFGLVTQIFTDNAESLSESLKLTGIHLGYGKIIATQKPWLMLDFKSDFTAQYIKSAWKSNFWDEEIMEFKEVEYTLGETILTLSAGYGIRISITDNFYIGQSFTGGIYYSKIEGNEVTPGAPEVDDDFDFRDYGNFGLQWNMQFTLGYNFPGKR